MKKPTLRENAIGVFTAAALALAATDSHADQVDRSISLTFATVPSDATECIPLDSAGYIDENLKRLLRAIGVSEVTRDQYKSIIGICK